MAAGVDFCNGCRISSMPGKNGTDGQQEVTGQQQ
jgi:hypothetical protein